jgi:hypothetical protein
MGTTTNNGWPTPVATDLVKDGWEAIKDLGDAIDTTLGVYSPGGKLVQIVNATTTTGVTSATNVYVDTTLTANITPTSASNNVLVFMQFGHGYKNNGNFANVMQMQFLRDATVIGTFSNLYYTNTTVELATPGPHFIKLDSPATTSAITYKAQFRSQNNTSLVGLQGGGSPASILLMEVTP